MTAHVSKSDKIVSVLSAILIFLTFIPVNVYASTDDLISSDYTQAEYINLTQNTIVCTNKEDLSIDPTIQEVVYSPLWKTDVYEEGIDTITEYPDFDSVLNPPLTAGITSVMYKYAYMYLHGTESDVAVYNKHADTDIWFEMNKDYRVLSKSADNDYVEFYDNYFVKSNEVFHKYNTGYANISVVPAGSILKVISIDNDVIEVERTDSSGAYLHGYIKFDSNTMIKFEANDPYSKLYHTTSERDADRYTETDVDLKDENRQHIIDNALSHLGGQYTYNGNSFEEGVDCSSFVELLYKEEGLDIGDNTFYQMIDGLHQEISINELKPADLIYYTKDNETPFHVVMYIGNGMSIEASSKSTGICILPVKWDKVIRIQSYFN